MGPAGSPPAHVAAGCKAAREGSEVTGSVQLMLAEDLPRRGTRRVKTNNGMDFGVPVFLIIITIPGWYQSTEQHSDLFFNVHSLVSIF